MNRRRLMLLLGGVVIAPRALRAQQKAMPVIGYLSPGSPGAAAPYVAAFRQGLSETGYDEGRNVAIEYRWAEGHDDRLRALAADLVSRQVDVIAAGGGSVGILAAKSATSTIPIVFFGGGDVVGLGFVTSLARPGGNLTGFTIMGAELPPKRLELLAQMVPQAGVIALLVNPNNSTNAPMIRDMQQAARAKGVELPVLKAGAEGDFEAAFANLAELHAGALVIAATRFSTAGAKSSSRLRHATPFRRSMSGANSPSLAA